MGFGVVLMSPRWLVMTQFSRITCGEEQTIGSDHDDHHSGLWKGQFPLFPELHQLRGSYPADPDGVELIVQDPLEMPP